MLVMVMLVMLVMDMLDNSRCEIEDRGRDKW
jgi:hypothetical protein